MATHVVGVHASPPAPCCTSSNRLGFSLNERQVKRAGLDYWEHVDPRVWRSWDAFEQELPTLGNPYFFSAKAKRLFWDVPLDGPSDVILIFGGETTGLWTEISRGLRRLHGFQSA